MLAWTYFLLVQISKVHSFKSSSIFHLPQYILVPPQSILLPATFSARNAPYPAIHASIKASSLANSIAHGANQSMITTRSTKGGRTEDKVKGKRLRAHSFLFSFGCSRLFHHGAVRSAAGSWALAKAHPCTVERLTSWPFHRGLIVFFLAGRWEGGWVWA